MLRRIWKWSRWLLLIVLVIVVAVGLFVLFAPTFGGKPDKSSQALMKQSQRYNGKIFSNIVPTVVSTPDPESDRSLLNFFFPKEGKNPSEPLESVALQKDQLVNDSFVWLGHSTVLFKTAGITVLADPVFYNASPIPFTVKPFEVTQPISIEELPAIDVVLISHDHYDHLDYRAVKELSDTVDTFLVPLGVKAHLQRWGVDSDKILEHDWYQTTEYSGVSFTQTPSRHFSGRGITNRFSTLWGSWVVKSDSMSVFFSGDSGYYDEFKRIGERYGPFDIAFMENGAYSVLWNQIHMFPEEAVQASIDLKATLFFPIHWGKYDLAFHTWTEPANRAMAAARENDVTMVSPLIGDVFNLSEYPSTPWWQKADTD